MTKINSGLQYRYQAICPVLCSFLFNNSAVEGDLPRTRMSNLQSLLLDSAVIVFLYTNGGEEYDGEQRIKE